MHENRKSRQPCTTLQASHVYWLVHLHYPAANQTRDVAAYGEIHRQDSRGKSAKRLFGLHVCPPQYNVERARAEVAFLTQPPIPTEVRTQDDFKVRVQVSFAGTTLPLPQRTYQSGTLTVKLGQEQANCPTTPEVGAAAGAKTPVELVFVEDGDSITPLTEPVPDRLQATVGFGYKAYVRVQQATPGKAAVTMRRVNLTVGGETVNVTVVIGAPNVGWPHYASGQTFDIAVQDDPRSLQQATREKPDDTMLTDCCAGLKKQPIQVNGETNVECAFKVTSAGGFQVFLHNVSTGDQNYNFDPDEQVSVQVTPATARDGEQPAPLTILKIERSPQNTPQLTNADTLKWLVTFSRPVHPISSNNFSVDGPPEVGCPDRMRRQTAGMYGCKDISPVLTIPPVLAVGLGLSMGVSTIL